MRNILKRLTDPNGDKFDVSSFTDDTGKKGVLIKQYGVKIKLSLEEAKLISNEVISIERDIKLNKLV